MKQCDVILVPCSDWEATHRVDKQWLRLEKNDVVLSITDFREVYQAGYNRCNDEWDGAMNHHAVNHPDFEAYCKSKGIQL